MSQQITIQLVTWNSADDLPPALAALRSVPVEAATVRVIDNASADNSVALVRQALPQADIIQLDTNVGFGVAHNIGMQHCTTPLVLLHNPDLVIDWAGVQKLLVAFDDERVGAVQGKLLRPQEVSGGRPVFDSTGIVHTVTLNGRERGAGETDHGQYDEPTDLLAVTGAAGLYRLSALQDVEHPTSPNPSRRLGLPSSAQGFGRAQRGAGTIPEIFDSDFFAYKEDVDLGWRLGKAGWKVRYLPVVIGVHARHVRREGLLNWGLNPVRVYQRLKSPRTRYSLRNWIWMLAKNASFAQLVVRGPLIDARLLLFAGLSVVYPPLLGVWLEIFKKLPAMLKKRSV